MKNYKQAIMEEKKLHTSVKSKRVTKSKFDKPGKARGDCFECSSSSHTQYFEIDKLNDDIKRITTDEYLGLSETLSGSSDTFRCRHGPPGKIYTEEGLLKRNLIKNLDTVPIDRKWNDECPPSEGWDMAKTLEFLVQDTVACEQIERLEAHLRDFVRTSENGYRIDTLLSVCAIVDHLVENIGKTPNLKQILVLLLKNMEKPILFTASSDVVTHFNSLQQYFGFLGYLLMRLEEDELFDLVSSAVIWQMSIPDSSRVQGCARLCHVLATTGPMFYETVVRMLAVTRSHRFKTFLHIACILACDSYNSCIEMMQQNIIENIFYRFNPYFPIKDLPDYDINPKDPHSIEVKLGDSSLNMRMTLTLLLVLLKTTLHYLKDDPKKHLLLPCPDEYAIKCFLWVYRFECRARDHKHERNTLTVIAAALFSCFGERLRGFSTHIMLDILALSVLTEVPPRNDWTAGVNFNTNQIDVQFKKLLIYLSVDLIKAFPANQFMVESQFWLLGLMYLIDPGLCSLRAKWSPSLFGEIRKVTLQALVCTLPFMPQRLIHKYGIIRRILWYIEWYTENPYEIPILYWCVRVLQVSLSRRYDEARQVSLQDLFDTHGIVVLMRLCYVLLVQKKPPVERSQVVIARCLQILTCAVQMNTELECAVYPELVWPNSVVRLASSMLDDVLYSLNKHFTISDRWLISLLNFIWEAIVWKTREYRELFVLQNGVYKLLDLVSLTKPSIQSLALAIVCDIIRSGIGMVQLITWRAKLRACHTRPIVTNRGATAAALFAAVFRDECLTLGIALDENGIIQNLYHPLMTVHVKDTLTIPSTDTGNVKTQLICIATELAGSRMSKAYSLLHLLSEDLANKVAVADESYKLYKDIKLKPEDEVILLLCSHFLTMKLNETWFEIKTQSSGYLPEDEIILDEFLNISVGWTKDIKQKQEDIIKLARKKELDEEVSLYAFLGRVRLNMSLDALRDVRCIQRSADRHQLCHGLLQDAVQAHCRRATAAKQLESIVLRTYVPNLDDQNTTGQYVKVYSIYPKTKPRPRADQSY